MTDIAAVLDSIKEIHSLLPCPFCGAPGELSPGGVYGRFTMRALCSRCRIGTLPVFEGLQQIGRKLPDGTPTIEDVTFTIEGAAVEAVQMWNTRAEREGITV